MTLGLADAVDSVHGLGLGGRVPPRVEENAIVGLGQIEPEPTGFQADEEHGSAPVAELADDVRPFARAAVEVAALDTGLIDSATRQAEEAGELAEHQNPVPVRHHRPRTAARADQWQLQVPVTGE